MFGQVFSNIESHVFVIAHPAQLGAYRCKRLRMHRVRVHYAVLFSVTIGINVFNFRYIHTGPGHFKEIKLDPIMR
jgi:hypothetical protein